MCVCLSMWKINWNLYRPTNMSLKPNRDGLSHNTSVGKESTHRRPHFNSWVRKIHWRRDRLPIPVFFLVASLVAQLLKNSPAMWETRVQSLGWQDPLKKGIATHSNIVACKITWTVSFVGSQRVRHDWATFKFPKTLNHALSKSY